MFNTACARTEYDGLAGQDFDLAGHQILLDLIDLLLHRAVSPSQMARPDDFGPMAKPNGLYSAFQLPSTSA